MIQSYKDLKVYQMSYQLAMEVYRIIRQYPKEELYSLTAQVTKSSRSIPANIAEGWAKRRHENIFKRHLLDAIGSCDETKVWLDFSLDCKYIAEDVHRDLMERFQETGNASSVD